jgi:GT2 family glycosyltransferase
MIELGRENDILVGFCHNGTVATVFMNSLLQLFAHDAQQDRRRCVEMHDAQGPYIHDNRSRIARYFLEETDKQWLLFFDNDMKFDADFAHRLVTAAEEHDAQILAGAYWNKYGEGNTYLSWLLFTEHGIKAVEKLPPSEDPVEVTAAGMGGTLIHRDVLQAVADAHPNDPWDTFSADMLVQYEGGGFGVAFSPEDFKEILETKKVKSYERMGEDVTFCLRARMAGFPTFGLPSLVMEHYKPHFMAHGQRSEASVLA